MRACERLAQGVFGKRLFPLLGLLPRERRALLLQGFVFALPEKWISKIWEQTAEEAELLWKVCLQVAQDAANSEEEKELLCLLTRLRPDWVSRVLGASSVLAVPGEGIGAKDGSSASVLRGKRV